MAQRAVRIRPGRLIALRPARSADDRVITGLAAGIAGQLGTDPMVIRLVFVALSAAGGAGVILYLLGLSVARGPTPTRFGDGTPAQATPRHVLAIGLVVMGFMILLRGAGAWFGDGVGVSVGLAALGSALIWTRTGDSDRAMRLRAVSQSPAPNAGRLTAGFRVGGGAALILAGMATFLAANDALAAARNVVFAVAVTVTGAALIFGPWMWRLARQLGEERRERIRSEERAEVAAHLHDSVLQTLALIQRSGQKDRMVALARSQERELRAWLYGRRRPADQGVDHVLTAALDEMASRIERLHQVPVEVVTVGDCAIDERNQAVVDATAEAVQNAAKHAGASVISVYAEADGEAVRVFVRDQGRGFSPATVTADRRGIADSIEGRMARYGGAAVITSQPGEGTEVKLSMPRKPA